MPYTPSVNGERLHILQPFDYLGRYAANMPPEESAQRSIYRLWLERAYLDFVESRRADRKVFRVFQQHDLPGGGGYASFVSRIALFAAMNALGVRRRGPLGAQRQKRRHLPRNGGGARWCGAAALGHVVDIGTFCKIR